MRLNFMKRFARNQEGNALILFAASLPALLGFAGMATDTIQWALWKRQIQRAADSGAIAGVYQRIQTANTLDDVKEAVNKDFTQNDNDVGAFVATYPKITMPANDSNGQYQVDVEVAVQKPLSFSAMFLGEAPVIKARARAAVVPAGEYCVISLENTGKTGILGSGNGSVSLNCGLITNSTSLDAAIAKGSASIDATVVAAVGGIAESANWQGADYLPFTLPIDDPFKDVPPTIPSSAPNRGAINDKPGDNAEYEPGVYSKIDVKGTARLKPGTYYVDGGNIDIGAQGRITGEGVTLVLTNAGTGPIGSFKMGAGGSINISAPTTGTYKGIAIYQDRRAVDTGGSNYTLPSSSPNQMNGNSSTNISGVVYFPNQQLTINGNGSMNVACMLLVTKRVVFTGSGSTINMDKLCNNAGADPFEGKSIRLVS